MRLAIAVFSRQGQALGQQLQAQLAAEGDTVSLTRCGGKGGPALSCWAKEHFAAAQALVFVGAVGIAVRAVAPLLRGKTSDPAVVAVDEAARFSVAVLCGHIGGANHLAQRVAALCGATPVITTATDVHGRFAADSWAAGRGYAILNPAAIKAVSARVLAGKPVALYSAFPVASPLPPGLKLTADAAGCDMHVDVRAGPQDGGAGPLNIVPPFAVLGLGCRRGTSAESIDSAFVNFCAENNIVPQAVGRVCSIELKKDEPGLVAFCRQRGLPLVTFSAAELRAQPGHFSASEFVQHTTGVDNVCERSAVAGAGGPLLIAKTSGHGLTMALALQNATIEFGGEE